MGSGSGGADRGLAEPVRLIQVDELADFCVAALLLALRFVILAVKVLQDL